MRKKDYYLIARKIRADIRAHFECVGLGMTNSEYLELRAKSDYATSFGLYLGEHLTLSPNDRAEFLELCGLRYAI